MKNINILLLSGLILLLGACRKDYHSYDTLVYNFTVHYPKEYSKQLASAVKVTLKNTITGVTQEYESDSEGRISATGITAGVYTVIATKTISPAEADTLVGVAEEILCSGTIPTLRITEAGASILSLTGSVAGGFVIKEFYYTGSKTPSGTNYLYDGFIEIYNNSTAVLYADSLIVGNTKPSSSSVYGFYSDKEYVYLTQAWMIPGTGKNHPVAPGASIVIAVTALNHKTDPNGNPNSPADLGKGVADFETYFNPTGTNIRDTDNPDVPNMHHQYYSTTAGFDWNIGINGTGLVLFKDPSVSSLPSFTEPNVSGTTRYLQVPVSSVLDAVDCVGNSTVTMDKKRLPETVDAGLTYVGVASSGRSVMRKVKNMIGQRAVLMDTNNSSVDFEVNNNPTPRKITK